MRKNKETILKFRVSPAEASRIKVLAGMYTGGNVSEWLRHAALSAPRVIYKACKKKNPDR